MRTLGRIEGKLDTVIDRNEKLRKEQSEQDTRISSLEGSRRYYKGALAVVTLVVAFLLSQVSLPFSFPGL